MSMKEKNDAVEVSWERAGPEQYSVLLGFLPSGRLGYSISKQDVFSSSLFRVVHWLAESEDHLGWFRSEDEAKAVAEQHASSRYGEKNRKDTVQW